MVHLTRRRTLTAIAGAWCLGAAGPALAIPQNRQVPDLAALATHRLAAAWDDAQGRHHIGILQVTATQVAVQASIEVPTRAHALALEPEGRVLAVARRPGEWLLRWQPPTAGDSAGPPDALQWHWLDEDARLNGHVLLTPDGAHLLTTETDLQTGDGCLVQRNRHSMAVTARWPTQGQDPHAMQWLPQGLLLVANGGIAARPETGRTRLALDRMDSSLVAMSPTDGRVHQTWALADRRQSLRHLAWHRSGVVGVAMQAQHDDPNQRGDAPVLALLDLKRSELRAVDGSRGLAGYGGDVAMIGDHWFVSGPRSDAVLRLSLDGSTVTRLPLTEGCALAGSADQSWGWASGSAGGVPLAQTQTPLAVDWKPDNHAVVF